MTDALEEVMAAILLTEEIGQKPAGSWGSYSGQIKHLYELAHKYEEEKASQEPKLDPEPYVCPSTINRPKHRHSVWKSGSFFSPRSQYSQNKKDYPE